MTDSAERPPAFIEADEAETLLNRGDVVFVDLSRPEVHAQVHVPGAQPLDYALLIDGNRPAPGRLPPPERLNQVISLLGIDPGTRVIAYDDEGGGRAARLVWTLHVMGLFDASAINGGIHAWANEGHPISADPSEPRTPGRFAVDDIHGDALALRDYVLERVRDGGSALLDSRTPEEFSGERALAERGGHIPGAVNLNWLDTIDRDRNMRLKPNDELEKIVTERGFDRDREVITYCQTHHRSSHSYLMLKHLGFERVRGYAGAWSEWGNDPDLPVETGH